MTRHIALLSCALAIAAAAEPHAIRARARVMLSNPQVRIEFGARGLSAIADTMLAHTFPVTQDHFGITIGGQAFDSARLPPPQRTITRDKVTYAWTAGAYRVDVVYELQPTWRFVSKQVVVTSAPTAAYRVDAVQVFRTTLGEPIQSVYIPKSMRPNLQTGDYGGAIRLPGGRGVLAVVQNPFLQFAQDGATFSITYRPDLAWQARYGPFTSDRGLMAPYQVSGRVQPNQMIPEWRLDAPQPLSPGMDDAEVETFTGLVRAFLLYKPDKPLDLMVGWCVNDYQIDVALPEGRTEYKRIIDQAAALGADHLLFAPSNSALSRREDSKDDWSWEHTLWLGLGQKLRKGEWDPRRDAVPPAVQELLDYAASKHVKLVAYVYPVLPFTQNPEWLVSPANNPSRKYASLGVRSLQDWLIDTLVAFQKKTGIGGYAFDHAFLGYEGTSRYAQWAGWRRVMEEVRRQLPDIAIDGRQAYHLYGPWTWLAGSYPHPTYNDEQPESFVPFPDLHFDRVSADRERYTAYRYRNYDFAPSEIVPGFITHQTSRADDTGEMPERKTTDRGMVLLPIRERDWDYLGWRYSLLSSIAVAGWNNVINMIPARDLEEFKSFSDTDRAWFRGWIDWTERNKEYLRRTRTILGQPALGKVDGTSAIIGDRGYIFLFNPNGRRLDAALAFDDSIGLTARPSSTFSLRELYPLEGRLVGKPGSGYWTAGDRVTLTMDGGSAAVYEVLPAAPNAAASVLFNAPGKAALSAGVLAISGVRGEVGTAADLIVRVPNTAAATSATVNGISVPMSMAGNVATVRIVFDGVPFRHYQPVVAYDPGFTGGRLEGRFTVPQRIFDQLAARRDAWPIPWTSEDFRSTWLAPERLLLFIQIAEPDSRWEARLAIDGRTVELKKAYSAVRVAPRTFVGFYADVSMLTADREHRLELQLPPLKAGQFQGVFFENVEPAYTAAISR